MIKPPRHPLFIPPRPVFRDTAGVTVYARSSGTILIIAMGVLLILSSFVLVFCREMRIEAIASANYVAAEQALDIEKAAEQYAIAQIVDQQEGVLQLPESTFAAVPVGDGYFWLVRPDYDDDSMPTFGLVDEASKINLNSATPAMLDLLPGLSSTDIPDSIADWRNPTGGSVDNGYYSSLPQPYQSKAAPFETVEEAILIKDMTRSILYGLTSTDASQPTMITDPQLQRGLFDLLTVYSTEPNTDATGAPRVNINNTDRTRLTQLLRNSSLASRANGILALMGNRRFTSIFDFALRVRLSSTDLQSISDNITTSANPALPQVGLININTAPRDVLLCLPGLGDSDVDALIAHRSSVTTTTPSDITWLLDALPSQAAAIGAYVTGHSYQYSADICAVSGNGRAFKRFRVIIDASSTTAPPHVIYRRDISQSGWPLVDDIITSLRQGAGLPPIATSHQARRTL